jgi:hypothetical protein
VLVTRRRWIAAAATLAAALSIWLLFGRRSDSQATEARAATDRGAGGAMFASNAARRGYHSSKDARAVTAQAKAPIIDEVALEKPSVCEGEENLVTVKAHAPDPEDEPFLHYMIGGSKGMTVPVRGVAEAGVLDHIKVVAFGRNGAATTVDLPRFEVKPCRVDHQLFVSSRLLPNATGDFEFSAHLRSVDASKRFEPVRYVWKFGDGSSSETSVPVETHDFTHRPQTSLATTFVVSCTAYAKTGEIVEGRIAIELNNTAFETLAYKGIVLVLGELDPRFPEPSPSGTSTQRVRLWHTHSQPVRIERLERMKLVLGKDHREEEVSLDALGVSVIAPGQVVETRPFHFDGEELPDVYALEYHVEGTTADGWPARGNFAIMRPAKPPTPTDHTPVIDAVLTAKILRARELLGKQYVTDEDIWRLEREGLMNDLKIEPNTRPPPAPPPRPPAPSR